MQVFHIPDAVYPGPGIFKDLDGAGIELLPVVAEGNMPGVTREKLNSQLLFQFLDLLGNGTLGDKQGFRGLGITF